MAIALDCCAVNDKQILITGATNGIGLAAAEALAALGANLAIVGRSKSRTRVASARIRAASGRGAMVATFICQQRIGRITPRFSRRCMHSLTMLWENCVMRNAQSKLPHGHCNES